ncbi:MAG TPA: hypothetical protein PLZ51_08850, partial [Aggregatilineales bacterium]|nr:hypothetical protein [Aggregatilineales bacterium]
MSLTFTHTLPVAPSTVYYMLTNEDALGYWLADRAYSRPQVGGHLLLTWFANGGWHVTGDFTEL